MQSVLNMNFFLILLIAFFVIAIAVVAGGMIWAIVKARKENGSNYIKTIVITVSSMLVAAVSWVLNLGWLRLFMTFFMVPVIHGIVFFIANLCFAKYIDKSTKMKKMNMLFIITYLIAYIILPDGGDEGGMIFFFGLIQNHILSFVAMYASYIAFIGHIILFIMQIEQVKKIKRNLLEKQ